MNHYCTDYLVLSMTKEEYRSGTYISVRAFFHTLFRRGDCLQDILINKCNCSLLVPSKYRVSSVKQGFCISPKHQLCVFRNQVLNLKNEKLSQCVQKCKPSCEFWEYAPMVSYGEFPGNADVQRLKEQGLDGDKFAKEHLMVLASFEKLQVK